MIKKGDGRDINHNGSSQHPQVEAFQCNDQQRKQKKSESNSITKILNSISQSKFTNIISRDVLKAVIENTQ